jgi:hypothetical protein
MYQCKPRGREANAKSELVVKSNLLTYVARVLWAEMRETELQKVQKLYTQRLGSESPSERANKRPYQMPVLCYTPTRAYACHDADSGRAIL